MKKVLVILLLVFWGVSLMAVTARLSVSPSRPVAGEMFMFELTTDSAEKFSLQLPEVPGVQISRNFSSNSVRRSIVNGKSSIRVERGLQAVAEKPGKIQIPPFVLDFDGKKVSTNALELIIRDPASLPPQEQLSAVMSILPDRPLYPGETVQLDLELFIPANQRLKNIRDIEVSGMAEAIPLQNDKQAGFIIRNSSAISRNGGYSVELSGLYQIHKSGTFDPVCRMTLMLTDPGEESFFFSPPARARMITARLPRQLTVKTLPSLPQGVINSGLTGTWQVSGMVSKAQLKTGDIAEITLNFSGKMPTLSFRAPELTIPDARVYPPETVAAEDKCAFSVKYPFVVIKPGSYSVSLPLAVFDPESGTYQVTKVDLSYQVEQGANQITAPEPESYQQDSAVRADKDIQADLVPFPVMPPSGKVKLPLYRNMFYSLIIPVIMVIILAIKVMIPAKRSPAEQEKKAELKKLLAKVRTSSDMAKTLQEEGTAVIAGAMDLPPGATFSDIAGVIEKDDQLLAKFFRQLEAGRFAPGSENIPENDLLRRKVCDFLKKLLPLFVLILPLYLTGADDFAGGKAAFDRGDYKIAAEKFQSSSDPALIYDQASAEFMLKNYPRALVLFSRAALLEPLNEDFQKAVKECRSKVYAVSKEPGVMERVTGVLRPDQWVAAAVYLIAAALWLWVFRRKVPGRGALPLIMAASALLMIFFAIRQNGGTYAPERAMVTASGADLRSIPAASGGISSALPAGTVVFIREEKGDFCRVENDTVSGWTEKVDLERFLPQR